MTTSDVPAIGWHDAVAQAVSTHPWLAPPTARHGAGGRRVSGGSSAPATTYLAGQGAVSLAVHAKTAG